MSLSSIFNFESIKGLRPRIPATLLGVVAVLCLMEGILRNLSDEWLYPSSKSKLGIVTFLENKVIASPKFKAPEIILLGTSRVMDGIRPKLLDQALSLPENSTINLGLQGGRPFDALRFYQRNQARIGQAPLVILCVDEWYFSSGWGLGNRFAIHAPLAERLAIAQEGETPLLLRPHSIEESEWEVAITQTENEKREQLKQLREKLLTDYIFKMRLKLRYIIPAFGIHYFGAKTRGMILNDENQVIRPEIDKGRKNRKKRKRKSREWGRIIEDPKTLHKRIHGFYRKFDSHPVLIGHVEQLADLVKSSGGRLVLVQMPNRGMHQEEVEKLYGLHYEQHLKTLKALAERKGISCFIYRMPDECGLTDRHFVDYGHLTQKGAETFTAFIADVIQKEALLQKSEIK